MFENVKKEPEDIFAGSEGAVPTPPPPVALAGQSLSSSREISSSPISSEQTREKQTSHWSWKMIGIVGMAIVIVAVAGVLSSRILASRTKSSDRVPSVQTDEEKMQELKKETESQANVTRFKGLGEMNPQQLWETTMDPSRRVLLRVTLEDAVKADRIFSILMGDQVEPRRKFIEEHAKEVMNLDV